MTSHPTAACPDANDYYWKWIHLSDTLPQYHRDCQDAKARYQLHLWDCDKCTVLINKYRNFVQDGLDA